MENLTTENTTINSFYKTITGMSEKAKERLKKQKRERKIKTTLTYIMYGLIIVVLIGVVVFIPIGLNKLLFDNSYTEKWVYDNSNNGWVGYIATYISAIIGGIISGGLTLIGVVATIKHSEKLSKKSQQNEYILTIPDRLVLINDLYFYLGDIFNKYKPEIRNVDKVSIINTVYYDLRDKYLSQSAKVNIEAYSLILKIYEEIYDFKADAISSDGRDSFQYHESKVMYPEFLVEFREMVKDTILRLETIRGNMELMIIKNKV